MAEINVARVFQLATRQTVLVCGVIKGEIRTDDRFVVVRKGQKVAEGKVLGIELAKPNPDAPCVQLHLEPPNEVQMGDIIRTTVG